MNSYWLKPLKKRAMQSNLGRRSVRPLELLKSKDPKLYGSLGVLMGLENSMRLGLKLRGFEWETRRQGDLEFGFWKIKYKDSLRDQPKRFFLIPGFGDSFFSWIFFYGLIEKKLKKDFDEVYVVNFPGFLGFQSFQKPFGTIDALSGPFFDLLDELEPHTIMGHSLGGFLAGLYVAECLENRRPRLEIKKKKFKIPQKMIVVNPSGVFENPDDGEDFQKRFRSYLDLPVENYQKVLFKKKPLGFSVLKPMLGSFFSLTETKEFIESFELRHLLHERLKTFKGEALVVWTDQDQLLPSRWLTCWIRELGPFYFEKNRHWGVELEGAGHMPQLEKPRLLAKIVSSFLNPDCARPPVINGAVFKGVTHTG